MILSKRVITCHSPLEQVLIPGVSFNANEFYRSCAFPWKHAPSLFRLGPRSPSLVKSMEGASENITPVRAISPPTHATNRYSSSRTWRQWLTWVILAKYAQSMISPWNIHSMHVSLSKHLSITQSIKQKMIFLLHSCSALISLLTL